MREPSKLTQQKRLLYKKLKEQKLFQRFCLAYAYAYSCDRYLSKTDNPRSTMNSFLRTFIHQRERCGDENFDEFIEEVRTRPESWKTRYNGEALLIMY